MFAVLTMVHTAETKEQLDNDTEALLTTARKHLCQFAVLKYQQMDGLNTALPFGVRRIDALRTLTTESLAVFIPFRVQEIYHENGVYYGQNVISKNMIIANRRHLLNGNSFILGVSGAGKSFTAKEEMTNIILTDPNADVIIIDPEREYLEQSELTEETLCRRALHKPKPVDEAVNDKIRSEQLDQAIMELPEVQRRRFRLYFDYGLTYEQIGKIEGCSKMPVKRSIDRAIEKIREKIKYF